MKKYELVIFDLDGTLLDTLEDLRDSLNHTLGRFGLPGLSLEDVRVRVGNGAGWLVALSIPGGRENPAFDAVLADFKAWYAAHSLIKTRPYPGVLALLEKLAAAGMKTAIVSNKPDPAVRSLNERFFSRFTRAALGERADMPRKPAPDMVVHVMDALGVPAEKTLYVGDSEVDVHTAAAAGTDCVSVSWGFRTESELREAGASVIVGSTEALLTAIGTLDESSPAT